MIELIKVRTETPDPEGIIDQVVTILEDLIDDHSFKVYRHNTIPTDYLIILEHPSTESASDESHTSQYFRFRIKELGMSSSSRWISVK